MTASLLTQDLTAAMQNRKAVSTTRSEYQDKGVVAEEGDGRAKKRRVARSSIRGKRFAVKNGQRYRKRRVDVLLKYDHMFS